MSNHNTFQHANQIESPLQIPSPIVHLPAMSHPKYHSFDANAAQIHNHCSNAPLAAQPLYEPRPKRRKLNNGKAEMHFNPHISVQDHVIERIITSSAEHIEKQRAACKRKILSTLNFGFCPNIAQNDAFMNAFYDKHTSLTANATVHNLNVMDVYNNHTKVTCLKSGSCNLYIIRM